MKIIRVLISLLFVVYFVSAAYAKDRYKLYFAPRVLFSIHETQVRAEFLHRKWGPRKIYAAKPGGSLALGYDLRPCCDFPVRLELEYGALEHVSKCGRVRILQNSRKFRVRLGIQTLMANMYADLPFFTKLAPFFSGGIGAAFIKNDIVSSLGVIKKNTATLAGHIGFGCSYVLTPRVILEAGYRFLMIEDLHAENLSIKISGYKNRLHQVLLGLRVAF